MLFAEQQLAMSSNNRVKELRNELTAERTKLASVEKHFQEKMAQQGAEFEALQARMRHAHEQHMIETAKMQAHVQQLEKSGDAALVQKLKQVGIFSPRIWGVVWVIQCTFQCTFEWVTFSVPMLFEDK